MPHSMQRIQMNQVTKATVNFFGVIVIGLTFELRHRHRRLSLAAMMMFKFHGLVETEGAVEVACSDLLAHGILTRKQ